MVFDRVLLPKEGEKIDFTPEGQLQVPSCPIIPFIEGDGIGVDITPVMRRVVDAAVEKAYLGQRKIAWMEVYAGEKAAKKYGDTHFLPEETLQVLQAYPVAIKGPLMTPVSGGMRSLNVALRQKLDLYVCLRPIRYFPGTPSPVKHPEKVDMVIFRENSEDIYAGIEFPARTEAAQKIIQFLEKELGVSQIRFPESSAIGIKPISQAGTERLVRKAIEYAIEQEKDSVTLVHKGNIMKFTEGGFKSWGYALARTEFGAVPLEGEGEWHYFLHPKTGKRIIIKDVIADAFLQQILLRPEEYSVIATMNLNGDYISDALAAQVGGIGIAPGANLGDKVAIFEATHGTAPRHAGKNSANPSSLLLSAEMLLRHIGWHEAAELVVQGILHAIGTGKVTGDFARLMPEVKALSTAEFGESIIAGFSDE
eukprot:TRINITY_DN6755_c0_g1_i1.p1 TRINITY_DN6755_c0_g1~~TRINITY_DN6755_c0_g1_i1.p1  ORF type:complete len:423 (+),score=-65.59 TRINITY_DN6755_c0_g1_i1:426-1694(+)